VLQNGDQITALPENNPDAVLHGGRARDHLMLLQNIQKQVLSKLAISEFSDLKSGGDTVQLLKLVVPLGLQTTNLAQLRNVAITLTKVLTYQNCSNDLFREDTDNVRVA
jgi:hypothetical protein